MRILVCGGRDYKDQVTLQQVLDEYADKISMLICGMARGADLMAYDWAMARGVPVARFYANWDVFGKAAGPLRNERMLTMGKPDLVIAFPGGKGTAHMIRIATAAGVPVVHGGRTSVQGRLF